MYCMGDRADDILRSFKLSDEDSKKYEVVKNKFDSHFVKRWNVIFERAWEKFMLSWREWSDLES